MVLSVNFPGITKYIQVINCFFKINFHRSSYLLKDGENVKECMFIPYQMEKRKDRRKVSVIGAAGRTGVIMAYTLLLENYCDEVVMFDKKETRTNLCAEALDLLHGISLHKTPNILMCTDMEKTQNSDLIIFNSDKPLKLGHTPLDVAQSKICDFKEIVPCLAKLSPNSVMLVITNPIDLMTYTVWKYSCFDKNRVLGTGTEIDTARFRYHIAKRFGVHPLAVGGWVIGENGPSSIPVWSSVTVAGNKLQDIDPKIGTCCDENNWDVLHKQAVQDGVTLVDAKGSTEYTIGQASNNIARAVLTNSKMVHAVSTQIKGLYGVQMNCFMSLPCVIGNRGVSDIIQLPLECDEINKLIKSSCMLEELINKMHFP